MIRERDFSVNMMFLAKISIFQWGSTFSDTSFSLLFSEWFSPYATSTTLLLLNSHWVNTWNQGNRIALFWCKLLWFSFFLLFLLKCVYIGNENEVINMCDPCKCVKKIKIFEDLVGIHVNSRVKESVSGEVVVGKGSVISCNWVFGGKQGWGKNATSFGELCTNTCVLPCMYVDV